MKTLFRITEWALVAAGNVTTFAPGDEVPDGAEVVPQRWAGTIILEGVRTEDDREFKEGALSWRELPLPFMLMVDTDFGHQDARICGSIETLERQDGGVIHGEGSFDLDGDDGIEAARLVGNGTLRWVSADTMVREFEIEREGCQGDENPMVELMDDDPESTLDDGIVYESDGCHEIFRALEAVIIGATIVPMPAFEGATIEAVTASGNDTMLRTHPVEIEQRSSERPLVVSVPEAERIMQRVADSRSTFERVAAAMTAAGPLKPSASWFEDPQLDGPTPLTVTEDGRVFGHAAQWGVCHTGITGKCVLAPRSTIAYSAFMSGGFVDTDEGPVRVGHLTLGCDHPDLVLAVEDVQRHYSMSGSVWANVCAGEDEHGVWVAGSVVPTVTDEQLALAKSLALSGDWRRIAGAPGLELVAALSVPVPGFPIGLAASGAVVKGPRAHVKDGEVLALVAAGVVTPCFECEKEALSVDMLEAYGRRLRRLEAKEASELRTRVKVPHLRSRVHS